MRCVLAAFFAAAGAAHLVVPETLAAITPSWVPFPTQVIFLTASGPAQPTPWRRMSPHEPTAGDEDETDASQIRNKYCIDAAFLAAVEKGRKAAKRDYPAFSEERIAYILTTGANWARPIGRFRLVVDKADPSNLVSFCGKGVRKISDTQFELVRNDFTPHAELDVLILKPTNR